jgi:hypothetical protein
MGIKDTIEEINEYTELAYSILQNDTNYFRVKKIISRIFQNDSDSRFETICFRLTIIDNYYSTQMNMRFFGIDDLAEKIMKIAKDEKTLQSMSFEYLEGTHKGGKMNDLFNGTYGINKNGNEAGQAASLISKYLYFLTDYKFPIFDNLVKVSYRLIKIRYPELILEGLNEKFSNAYFQKIRELNIVTEINDYNKLDNFLWLISKLTQGIMSLILDKGRYIHIVKDIEIPKGTKSGKVDELIRKYIEENIASLNDLFNENELKFMKYTYGLMPVK